MGDRMQRVKGKANEVAGKAERRAGADTGDRTAEGKGEARALKGKAQQAVGTASSTVKMATR
jgi:uncharacterized protein YjbJ (UPF0337 family)